MENNIMTLKNLIHGKSDNHFDIKFMLDNIGHPDSYIRDNLIYQAFCFVIHEDKIDTNMTEHILETCLDENHLYFNLNQSKKDDSVLVRSFSALVIALILYKDASQQKISKTLVTNALNKSVEYMQQEFDYRGYIDGKGWAHSVAHGSDLLSNVIAHPLCCESLHTKCLDIIRKCLITDYAYIDEEDERLLNVIDKLLKKGMSDIELKRWVERLFNYEEQDYYKNHRVAWNVKKFSTTLYLYLLKNKSYPETENWLNIKYM
ncbi:hypothetical protein CSE16_16825 [Solibacillus sp. R5-41]|uniref:DUF2785 domain-containing protein n=1 Tax=Solibacillus sp. R5-41 TaxID=2048654 RepID=UPI000C1285C9|nr:DUF2785 domain-containing protein [Solibacillus sp. R5-41]ATP41561.1 hypothetical protein CSE16_16825 [Solibacillus sp. R5-41]